MKAPTLVRLGVYLLLALGLGCGAALTPADEATIASDQIQMTACAAGAHLCKLSEPDGGLAECWREYDACMAAHGFTDGGR